MALNQVGLERLGTQVSKKIGASKNLVINGAMQVAQRATSSTSSGFKTLDRWSNSYSADANITFTQHALTSSDTGPYEDGFRFSNHAQNGSTGAGATQSLNFQQPIEAQNVAQSGWVHTSSSSFITLSFWAKSSVGQTFNMSVMTIDGTVKNFPFDVTLAANTWTKVTKTIPGDSSLQIDADNGEGFRININVFTGTDRTANSVTNDTWQNWTSSTRFRDNTSTWFTTNGATFEYTGVQLEVGSVATEFEHKSYGDTLWDCQRYCAQIGRADSGEDTYTLQGLQAYGTSAIFGTIGHWPRQMRAKPTVTLVGVIQYTNSVGGNVFSPSSGSYNKVTKDAVGSSALGFSSNYFVQGGYATSLTGAADGANYIQGEAEL
jgi:hypothetical protein